jgi:hypothetical protein
LDEATVELLSKQFDDTRHPERNLLSVPSVRTLAISRPVREIVEAVLGPKCFAVRGIFFNKTRASKIFLALSDDYSAKIASELCGKEDQLKISYNLSETGHDTHVSFLTGKAQSNKANLTQSKSYYQQSDYRFDMKTFTELRNAQSVTIAYDGFNPMPPMFCYLKPYFNDPNKSYFRQAADGGL